MSDAFNERLRLIRFRRKRERSTFRQELRIIPKWLIWLCAGLWVLAVIIGVAANLHIAETGGAIFPGDRSIPNVGESTAALAAAITGIALVVSVFLFMLAYVYRDAKRRGMNAGLWTLLVLILSPAYLLIGLIIYLLVREPLPYACPQCSATVNARYNFCPNCKYNLHPACPQCQREVSDSDKFCPYCGTELTHGPTPAIERAPTSNPAT
jgi:RNA polymerase subunit RPABC4/transcription elongation factor Spt4